MEENVIKHSMFIVGKSKWVFTFLGLAIFVVVLPSPLNAFPETVRHGYLSCVTCHLSPSGRGILTPYGKTLSFELYSYKKLKNENKSLESEVPWWQIGGRARLMQLIEDTQLVNNRNGFAPATFLF